MSAGRLRIQISRDDWRWLNADCALCFGEGYVYEEGIDLIAPIHHQPLCPPCFHLLKDTLERLTSALVHQGNEPDQLPLIKHH